MPGLVFYTLWGQYLCGPMYTELINPDDTIVALASPEGIGALGIIRLSGRKAFGICSKIFKGPDLAKQDSHTIHYGHIYDRNTLVDEVMVSLFRSPKSFTTEDSIEISCHGSLFIQRQIIRLLVQNGARLAAPGEFTLRAYINGRIDLAQAEAVGDIIASRNSSQLDIAMKQMRGGLSSQLKQLREQLLNFISLVELELDFGEEDVEFANRSQLRAQVENMRTFIRPLVDSFAYGNAIKNGIPVAIVGRPNAGKSSLLNRLLDEDRAIVSEIAGTTRDTIEEELHVKGVSFRFIDTAGIRQTEDVIEKIGIEKALKKIEEAVIVIYIFDLSTTAYHEIREDLDMIKAKNFGVHILVLGNKKDLVTADKTEELIAKLKKDGMEHLSAISLNTDQKTDIEWIRNILFDMMHLQQLSASQTIVSNQRHYHALQEADEALYQVLDLMNNQSSSDLLALEMKRAVTAIGNITGEISNDEVLGNIFGKFCIGK